MADIHRNFITKKNTVLNRDTENKFIEQIQFGY